MIFIGIDPGITGAIAEIDPYGYVVLRDTPTIEIKKGNKTKIDYAPLQMAAFLDGFASTRIPTTSICHVFIEKVGAMPKQGVTGMFGFGKGFGMWLGILAAFKIPYTLVTPQAWKKELMQGMADKDASRIRAQQLFPNCVGELSRKKDIGRADALLIAEYGRRVYKT